MPRFPGGITGAPGPSEGGAGPSPGKGNSEPNEWGTRKFLKRGLVPPCPRAVLAGTGLQEQGLSWGLESALAPRSLGRAKGHGC